MACKHIKRCSVSRYNGILIKSTIRYYCTHARLTTKEKNDYSGNGNDMKLETLTCTVGMNVKFGGTLWHISGKIKHEQMR